MIEGLNGTLSRDDLFEKVWTTPITEIARSYSVRDHEIIKLCDKNNIPRPPTGYWSKYRHGFRMDRPPLPPEGTAAPISVPPKKVFTPSPKKYEARIFRNESPTFPKSEGPPHSLVAKTYRAYGSIKPDRTDRLRAKEEALNVYVGYRSLDRAMNFMDLLIKNLESRGYSILVRMNSAGDQWITYAVIDDVRVPFHIEEMSEKRRGSRWGTRDVEYMVTGELKVFIDHYFGETRQPSWSETKTISIEHRLPQVIEGLIEAAGKLKVIRIEEEKRLEKIRLEEKRKREIEAEERLRKEQIAQLEPCSLVWEKANRIRGFVSALEAAAIQKFGHLDPNGEIAGLINRAMTHADSIDPVIQSLKVMDEK